MSDSSISRVQQHYLVKDPGISSVPPGWWITNEQGVLRHKEVSLLRLTRGRGEYWVAPAFGTQGAGCIVGPLSLGSIDGLQLKPLTSRPAWSRAQVQSILSLPAAGCWCRGRTGRGGWPQCYFPLGGRLLVEFCHQSLVLHLKRSMTNWACLERVNRKEAGFRKSCHIRSEKRNWERGEEKLLGGSDNHPLKGCLSCGRVMRFTAFSSRRQTKEWEFKRRTHLGVKEGISFFF